MKRRIREIIKVNEFDNEFDFFIVAKPKSNDLSFAEIKKILEKLFANANILKKVG
jgi:ribonuclease P protein component